MKFKVAKSEVIGNKLYIYCLPKDLDLDDLYIWWQEQMTMYKGLLYDKLRFKFGIVHKVNVGLYNNQVEIVFNTKEEYSKEIVELILKEN